MIPAIRPVSRVPAGLHSGHYPCSGRAPYRPFSIKWPPRGPEESWVPAVGRTRCPFPRWDSRRRAGCPPPPPASAIRRCDTDSSSARHGCNAARLKGHGTQRPRAQSVSRSPPVPRAPSAGLPRTAGLPRDRQYIPAGTPGPRVCPACRPEEPELAAEE